MQNLLIFSILCWSCNSVNSVKPIEIFPNCTDQAREVIDNNESNIASVITGTPAEIIHELTNKYNFKLLLPKEFEYCGHLREFGCTMGLPDKYHIIDTTLTLDIYLTIETNPLLIKQSEIYNLDKRDSILSKWMKDDPEYKINLKRSNDYLENRGFKLFHNIPQTKCKIDNNYFYGEGYTETYMEQHKTKIYKIHGMKNNTLIGIELSSYNSINNIEFEKLYCILHSVEINKN